MQTKSIVSSVSISANRVALYLDQRRVADRRIAADVPEAELRRDGEKGIGGMHVHRECYCVHFRVVKTSMMRARMQRVPVAQRQEARRPVEAVVLGKIRALGEWGRWVGAIGSVLLRQHSARLASFPALLNMRRTLFPAMQQTEGAGMPMTPGAVASSSSTKLTIAPHCPRQSDINISVPPLSKHEQSATTSPAKLGSVHSRIPSNP